MGDGKSDHRIVPVISSNTDGGDDVMVEIHSYYLYFRKN